MIFEGKEFEEVDQANWKDDSGIYLKFSDGNGNYRWFIEKKPEPLTNWEISVLRSSLIKNEEIHDKNVEIIIKKLGKLEAQK